MDIYEHSVLVNKFVVEFKHRDKRYQIDLSEISLDKKELKSDILKGNYARLAFNQNENSGS